MPGYRTSMRGYLKHFLEKIDFHKGGEALKEGIREYLMRDPDQEKAHSVYERYLDLYNMPGPKELFKRLLSYEKNVSATLPAHRDHYTHSVEVFLLGLALYHENETIKNGVNQCIAYKDNYPDIQEEFLYRWGLTALFHDIGYPVQLINDSLKIYLKSAIALDADGWCASRTGTPVITLTISELEALACIHRLWPAPEKTEEYRDKYPGYEKRISSNMLHLIGEHLSRRLNCGSGRMASDSLRYSLEQGMERGVVDHGLFSAIIMIKWINTRFKESDWNPAYFYYPVIDAASAILLHNSYKYLFQRPPFNLPPLPVDHHPLAWLLMFCDEIQEADRESYGFENTDSHPKLTAAQIDITNDSFHLLFEVAEPADPDEEVYASAKEASMKCMATIEKELQVEHVFKTWTIEIEDLE